MPIPKGRILCTEDDPDTRELLSWVLSEAGYQVVCTEKAEQAIVLAKAEHFDLFLVDSWMPGVSGADFTRKLRKFDIKTPVLFYSGAAYEADKENARIAGAQGYLVKPVRSDDLVAEVARLIANAQVAKPIALNVPVDSELVPAQHVGP